MAPFRMSLPRLSYFGKAESKALGSSAISATEEFCYGDLWDDADFSEALRDTQRSFLPVSLARMHL